MSYDVNKARVFRKVWLAGFDADSVRGVFILRQFVVVELIHPIEIFIYVLNMNLRLDK
jgi:hypothetical protein